MQRTPLSSCYDSFPGFSGICENGLQDRELPDSSFCDPRARMLANDEPEDNS